MSSFAVLGKGAQGPMGPQGPPGPAGPAGPPLEATLGHYSVVWRDSNYGTHRAFADATKAVSDTRSIVGREIYWSASGTCAVIGEPETAACLPVTYELIRSTALDPTDCTAAIPLAERRSAPIDRMDLVALADDAGASAAVTWTDGDGFHYRAVHLTAPPRRLTDQALVLPVSVNYGERADGSRVYAEHDLGCVFFDLAHFERVEDAEGYSWRVINASSIAPVLFFSDSFTEAHQPVPLSDVVRICFTYRASSPIVVSPQALPRVERSYAVMSV